MADLKGDAASQFWDQAAASFDDEPDHGLRAPEVRHAWTALLATWLPPAPAAVLDLGCGTGSLSLVMAELGYTVTGVDLSPAMIAHAEAKACAAGQAVTFHVMDAADPVLERQRFDAIVCRHLLWTLPQPGEVLRRWRNLLVPGGRLLLVEGFWHTGAGLRAQAVMEAVGPLASHLHLEHLSGQSALWGRAVDDVRYLVVADLQVPSGDTLA